MILTGPLYPGSKTECCNIDYNLENLSKYYFPMYSFPFVYMKSVVDMRHSRVAVRESLAYNIIKKETLAQVFSCKFCEIFKKNFFYKTPLVAASAHFFHQFILTTVSAKMKAGVCSVFNKNTLKTTTH